MSCYHRRQSSRQPETLFPLFQAASLARWLLDCSTVIANHC
ncbi:MULTISPECIES: hypothetical protein [Kingella]|nr:hypothetical protein [Kingella bonacorsii]